MPIIILTTTFDTTGASKDCGQESVDLACFSAMYLGLTLCVRQFLQLCVKMEHGGLSSQVHFDFNQGLQRQATTVAYFKPRVRHCCYRSCYERYLDA